MSLQVLEQGLRAGGIRDQCESAGTGASLRVRGVRP